MRRYIGVDLGGTNTVAGLVDEKGKLYVKKSVSTPRDGDPERIVDTIYDVVTALLSGEGLQPEDIQAIGIGSPGVVDIQNGVVLFANHLHFRNTPLAELCRRRFNRPVHLVNDANAAAYGEYIAGGGRGASSLVAITLGTGIGGGIIIDGKILTGYAFAGAELGHMVIDMDGRACSCGKRGCFETYASATGLIHSTQAYMRNHPETLMWKLCNNSLGNVSGRTAFDAKRAGDAGGESVIESYIHTLAIGLGNIINSLEPEILLIGGGISHEGEYLLGPLREEVHKQLFAFSQQKTRIVSATLGNDAGIIGAALADEAVDSEN